jgi:acyl carrier protein
MQQATDIQTIRKELCYFISANILAEGVKVENDTILSNIGVDSFSVIEIILFIERKFGVIIPDESLVPENLKSVGALADCTFRHLQTK